jgi:dinuclear metal center YbgI/SA1388 family protein
MKVRDAVATLQRMAPLEYAQPWDNVGLLVGDPDQPVMSALLTIDYTTAVASEGRARGCDFIVSYHPPIFQPLKRILPGEIAFEAIRSGLSIYSPHTALDAAEGGTNDVLADALGLTGAVPLRAADTGEEYKLVVFVPEAHADAVSAALFEATSGQFGRPTFPSFRVKGTSTFFREEEERAAGDQNGRVVSGSELRIEMTLPAHGVLRATAALRRSHPHSNPSFDLVRLATRKSSIGTGRIGALDAVSLPALLERIKRNLSLASVLVAAPDGDTAGRTFQRGAVCAGACADHLRDAAAQGAEVYLTGELRHHDAVWAIEHGMTVLCVLHSNSERATLTRLRDVLLGSWKGVDVHLSTADRDPFAVR